MADFPPYRIAAALVVLLFAVLFLAELIMNTSFSEEAVRTGVKTEFNKTKSCLIQRLSPYESSNQSDTYAKLISSYLIRGINTSESLVRSVRREGWAYYVNASVRYNDLPSADQNMIIYTSILGERRIIGQAPDLGGQFGAACSKTCEDNPMIPDAEACRSACGKVSASLAGSGCMPNQ